MIIILEPEKDTYVTNFKTVKNDGAKANVGQAATLDLFKLHNENKNSNSWAAFKFTSGTTIADSHKLVLTDANNITKTFEFDTANDPGNITAGNIRISINGQADNSQYATTIKTAINAVSDFGITAHSNSNNELILKQDKSGSSGDTSFTLPTNMTHVSSLTKFARIDYSAVLVKFDLKKLKEQFDISGDIANDGAFNSLKAELVLKDVTTGITKPKNFNLSAFELKKDFNEGVGKDTVHFSDKSNTNFQTFDGETNWEVESFITVGTSGDAVDQTLISSSTSSFLVEKGSEDIVFDVTNYIKTKIQEATPTNKGILISFPITELYDGKSYFAKRVGSRHLVNKKIRPELRIKINDSSSSYTIPTNSFNKKRFLNSTEDFFLFNNANSKLEAFASPAGFNTLEFEIGSILKNKITSGVTNYRGDSIAGIKKASLLNTDMSRYNTTIEASILKDKPYEDTLKWYFTNVVAASSLALQKIYKIKDPSNTNFATSFGAANSTAGTLFIPNVAGDAGSGNGTAYEIDMSSLNLSNTTKTIKAVNIVQGKLYKIITQNSEGATGTNTDFTTSFGAANNTANTLFVAKASGAANSGDGTAYEISDLSNIDIVKKTVYSEKIQFHARETANEVKYENLIAVTRINENDLFANNSVSSIEVYFVDTKKEFDVVKTPYELPSENIGDAFYQVLDVESNKVLIDYHESNASDANNKADATKMFFDGEKYKFNFYVPEKYKDLRLNFKFMYKDPVSNVKRYIFNEKYSVRVV